MGTGPHCSHTQTGTDGKHTRPDTAPRCTDTHTQTCSRLAHADGHRHAQSAQELTRLQACTHVRVHRQPHTPTWTHENRGKVRADMAGNPVSNSWSQTITTGTGVCLPCSATKPPKVVGSSEVCPGRGPRPGRGRGGRQGTWQKMTSVHQNPSRGGLFVSHQK